MELLLLYISTRVYDVTLQKIVTCIITFLLKSVLLNLEISLLSHRFPILSAKRERVTEKQSAS